MIFAASEPPQYIVVPPTVYKMDDMVCISQHIQKDRNYKSYSPLKKKQICAICYYVVSSPIHLKSYGLWTKLRKFQIENVFG